MKIRRMVMGLAAALGVLLVSGLASTAWAKQLEVDGFQVHYSAFNADVLSAEVATQYGLTRSKHLGLLNISVQKLMPQGLPQAVMAQVTAQAVNEAGQLKILQPRQVKEREAIYYLSEFRVSHLETLTFTVRIQPPDLGKPIELTFKQQFFTR